MQPLPLKLGLLAVVVIASPNVLAQAQKLNEIQILRTKRLFPLPTAPAFDWQRIQNAYSFARTHRDSIDSTLRTTFILSLLASKDTEPIIASTGKLSTDFNKRMRLTIDWMNEIIASPKDKTEFIKKNYKRSVDLGLMHLEISQATKLKWNPIYRVPVSQQAFAYMLHAFAWQPVEKMIATHEIDPAKDGKAIDDWLYLWHTLGYGMGLEPQLLPTTVKDATILVRQLRGYQYPHAGEEIPHPIRDMIRNEMEFLYLQKDNGLPIDDPTKLEIRKKLAAEISYSPGLSQALGLGTDPLLGLQNLADTID